MIGGNFGDPGDLTSTVIPLQTYRKQQFVTILERFFKFVFFFGGGWLQHGNLYAATLRIDLTRNPRTSGLVILVFSAPIGPAASYVLQCEELLGADSGVGGIWSLEDLAKKQGMGGWYN